MPDQYRIQLNFLPVVGSLPPFRIYRREKLSAQESRPADDVHSYSLPRISSDREDRAFYWIALETRPDYQEFTVEPSFNNDLTRWALLCALRDSAASRLSAEQFWMPTKGFVNEIHFSMQRHNEGEELLVIEPYYLRAAQKFGFLAAFHFRLAQTAKFSRRVQQLSLSLDKSYRRNLDYYLDRTAKVNGFLNERWDVLSTLVLPGSSDPVQLSREFEALPADRLRSRVYIFGSGREARSQFVGLRDYGPLKPLDSPPTLLFVFREQDRQAARTLAMALRGSRQRQRFNFPGFEALFKSQLLIDSNPVVIPDLSEQSMTEALARVQERNQRPVPVLVVPDQEDNGYLAYKAIFTHAGIPTQVCTLHVIQDENALKWAIANIALQVFCKAGGQPWKVRPTAERSLIIGISQSHKLRKVESGYAVEKYFAFSVLTDSSGLFQRIQVLGEAKDHSSYLSQLQANLRDILAASADMFSRVVIHTSFKLKHQEIDAIQRITQETAATADSSKCRFAVVKVNHKARFFGVNHSVNSLVPYEATRIRLGYGEYLVWFEGIFPDKPTVTKAFPGPTHLQFLRITDDPAISDQELLQDLVNLSGANWRGFNAKSAPVSVFYCHLVADLVHDFHEQGLPLPQVADLRPWFL
jgi:hypothetical protein